MVAGRWEVVSAQVSILVPVSFKVREALATRLVDHDHRHYSFLDLFGRTLRILLVFKVEDGGKSSTHLFELLDPRVEALTIVMV